MAVLRRRVYKTNPTKKERERKERERERGGEKIIRPWRDRAPQTLHRDNVHIPHPLHVLSTYIQQRAASSSRPLFFCTSQPQPNPLSARKKEDVLPPCHFRSRWWVAAAAPVERKKEEQGNPETTRRLLSFWRAFVGGGEGGMRGGEGLGKPHNPYTKMLNPMNKKNVAATVGSGTRLIACAQSKQREPGPRVRR